MKNSVVISVLSAALFVGHPSDAEAKNLCKVFRTVCTSSAKAPSLVLRNPNVFVQRAPSFAARPATKFAASRSVFPLSNSSYLKAVTTAKADGPWRNLPRNQAEANAWNKIVSKPISGKQIKIAEWKDPRFRSGWQKRTLVIHRSNGNRSEFHWNFHPSTGNFADIKVKDI